MQKGSARLLIVLLVLIIIALAGVYLYQNSKVNNSLPSPNFVALSKPADNDYSSKDLGFEFKYAQELILKEDSEEEFNRRGNGDFRKNFKGYVGYEPGKFSGAVVLLDKSNSFDTNPFTIWAFDNQQNLSIDEWYKNYWYYPFVWGDFTYTGKFVLAPKKEATISGITAKSGVIDYQPGKPKFIYVAKDNKIYLFRVIGETGDKILPTFKFTD